MDKCAEASGGEKDIRGLRAIVSSLRIPARHLLRRPFHLSGAGSYCSSRCEILVLHCYSRIVGIDIARDPKGWDAERKEEYASEGSLPALPVVLFLDLLEKGIPYGMAFFRLPSDSGKVYSLGGEKMKELTDPETSKRYVWRDEGFGSEGVSDLVSKFNPMQQPCLAPPSMAVVPPRMLAAKARPFVLTAGDRVYVLHGHPLINDSILTSPEEPCFEVLEPADSPPLPFSWKWRSLPPPLYLTEHMQQQVYPLVIGRRLLVFTFVSGVHIFDLDEECWQAEEYQDYDANADGDDNVGEGKKNDGGGDVEVPLVALLRRRAPFFPLYWYRHSLCLPVDIPMLPGDGSHVLLSSDGMGFSLDAYLLDGKLNVRRTQQLGHVFPRELLVLDDPEGEIYPLLIDQGCGRVCSLLCGEAPTHRPRAVVAVSVLDLRFVGDGDPEHKSKFLQVSIVKEYVYDASSIFLSPLFDAFFMQV